MKILDRSDMPLMLRPTNKTRRRTVDIKTTKKFKKNLNDEVVYLPTAPDETINIFEDENLWKQTT